MKVFVLFLINPAHSYGDYTDKDFIGVFSSMKAVEEYKEKNPTKGIYEYYDWEECEVM